MWRHAAKSRKTQPRHKVCTRFAHGFGGMQQKFQNEIGFFAQAAQAKSIIHPGKGARWPQNKPFVVLHFCSPQACPHKMIIELLDVYSPTYVYIYMCT